MKTPKYKIGEIVLIKSKKDNQKVCQGKVFSAQIYHHEGKIGTWFYGIEIPNSSQTDEPELVYSYEEDTGDAKTKFLSLIEQK